MNYLVSQNFDAQTMIGKISIQHYVSEALDKYLKFQKNNTSKR